VWQLTVRDGTGCLSEFRTDHGDSPRSAASHQHIPLALGARGLAALYAGAPAATLRRAGLASGGSPEADAALAAAPFMLDSF
jgi:Sterol carrier protein domain